MKKTIRLTESDLVKMVKRVVNEQNNAPYDEFISVINEAFPNAQWVEDRNGFGYWFGDNEDYAYAGYFAQGKQLEVYGQMVSDIMNMLYPIRWYRTNSFLKKWCEESLGVEVDDIIFRTNVDRQRT
jgi:hypothetical protein